MSFDLFVGTQRKPTAVHVDGFFAEHSEVSLVGSFSAGSNVLVQTATDSIPLFLLDPPIRATAEEMEGNFAGFKPRPRWVTFISVPAVGGEPGIALAGALALALAQLGDGLVYDPQADEFVWPDGRREARRQLPSQRVSALDVEWFLPMSRLTAATARDFLLTANHLMPSVTPKRNNDFEAWIGGEWETRNDMFFHWRGRKPCYDGSIFVRSDPDFPSPGARSWNLALTLDEWMVRTNAKTLAAVVDLFVAVAEELGAFYAAAYVERGWLLEGRTLYSDAVTQSCVRMHIPTWSGLPGRATWLSWFGAPYRDLVKEALEGLGVEHENGLFLRMAELPADSEELAARFPRLPVTLTFDAGPFTEASQLPNGQVIQGFGTRRGHAQHIPELD